MEEKGRNKIRNKYKERKGFVFWNPFVKPNYLYLKHLKIRPEYTLPCNNNSYKNNLERRKPK